MSILPVIPRRVQGSELMMFRVAIVQAFFLAWAGVADAASFAALDFLPSDVSGDGQVIVGGVLYP